MLENARRIFDVARLAARQASHDDTQDFALLIRPDGGLHFLMEAPFSLEGASSYVGAGSAWRVSHSREGVRVEGRDGVSEVCLKERRNSSRITPRRAFLPDEPRYRITSPLLTSCTASSGTEEALVESAIRRA